MQVLNMDLPHDRLCSIHQDVPHLDVRHLLCYLHVNYNFFSCNQIYSSDLAILGSVMKWFHGALSGLRFILVLHEIFCSFIACNLPMASWRFTRGFKVLLATLRVLEVIKCVVVCVMCNNPYYPSLTIPFLGSYAIPCTEIPNLQESFCISNLLKVISNHPSISHQKEFPALCVNQAKNIACLTDLKTDWNLCFVGWYK